MANEPARRTGPLTGALLLIAIGGIFLYANLVPEWDPWPLISRYWPVLLIVLGLGKLIDALRSHNAPTTPGAPGPPAATRRGGEIGAILVVILLVMLAAVGGRRFSRMSHEEQSVDAQGAESVRMNIEMPTGHLKISGGAAKLLDADFNFREAEGQPHISYDHSGKEGTLTISQSGKPHFGGSENRWQLRLNNDQARELHLEMGAGQGDLDLRGVRLTKLSVEMGAGELNADLTGDWNHDVDVRIEGGVGSASIRLPHDVGVRVHAEGGIGSINVRGLQKRGGFYVNDAYGSSPVTMNVSVEGGVGEIRLIEQQ